jgi:Na+-transporting NADH:ubiquinone oxidoreductase subunit NqrC
MEVYDAWGQACLSAGLGDRGQPIDDFRCLCLCCLSWQLGSSVEELVHLELDENNINASVWYRHRVTYEKQNPGSGGDGEVNYSFTHNWTWSDSWLGKVVYDQWFNKKYSDPPGLVN